MEQGDAVLLLVDKPGLVRDALQCLLNAVTPLKVLLVADSVPLALEAARDARPHMILVGAGLPEEHVVELVRCIKREQPKTSCLVLTERARHSDMVRSAGADGVMAAGLPVSQVLPAIQQMLARGVASFS